MDCDRHRSCGYRGAMLRARAGLGILGLASGAAALVLGRAVPTAAAAQQSATATPALVFNQVTVVDVEQGKLVPDQRVVITGNRIEAVGGSSAVKIPKGAQVVDARGKYLIPGLWDAHIHTVGHFFDLLFIANGVTGTRWADAGNTSGLQVPKDLPKRRQEILAGERVGPPREIASGWSRSDFKCTKADSSASWQACLAKMRSWFDEEVGFDMIKTYNLSRDMYFAVAAEARRRGKQFGGHVTTHSHGPPSRGPDAADSAPSVSAIEASDSGARLLDHVTSAGELHALCFGPEASIERCRPAAERLRRNNTWWVPTLVLYYADKYFYTGQTATRHVADRLREVAGKFWADSLPNGNWLRDVTSSGIPDSLRSQLSVAQQVGLPVVAGTDAFPAFMQNLGMLPGFFLHAELAAYVQEGLTPLNALQSATLNPAKMWNATDSLGTVAPGKLADLVLLDADPLADITNTTTIRAVVANGRYFDRAALDSLLAEVRTKREADVQAGIRIKREAEANRAKRETEVRAKREAEARAKDKKTP